MSVTIPATKFPGVLTTITNDYTNAFSGYTTQLMHYGKEIFVVLLAINITWIALWYAFDKDSLAAGMSGFLKKFTVAMIFYTIMVSPQYMGSLIGSSTQMGLAITKQTSLDPSYLINVGMNVGLQALASITHLSFIFNASGVILAIAIFFIIVFCFMSVALQVAVTLVIATALATFSCFTLGFSGLGATAGIARKSIDALICACFKLFGYYIVIGASFPVFSSWKNLPTGFFQDTRQAAWLCASALMFWLLSKSLPAVFERIGGGLVGETAGVDFAALAVSAAKTAVMGMAKTQPVPGGNPSGGPGGKSKGFQESAWGKSSGPSKTAANDPTPSGPNNTGGGQAQMKAPGGAAANDNNNKTTTPQNNAANDSHTGKGGSSSTSSGQSSKGVSGGGRTHTYPGMSKDKAKQTKGA